MPDRYDKLLVTPAGALRRTYAADGYRRVRAGLDELSTADETRGLRSRVLLLGHLSSMRAVGPAAAAPARVCQGGTRGGLVCRTPTVGGVLTPQRARRVGAFLLMVLAVTAALSLARWQYSGWTADRAAQARDLSARPAVPLASVLGPDAAFPADIVGRPVRITGRWLPDGGFVVADRSRGDRDGYWAVTPMTVVGSDSAVLVVRGWSPGPQPPQARGPVRVEGYLQPGEGSGVPDPDPTDRVVPELRLASVTQLVDRDLYGGFVVLSEAAPAQPLPVVTPDQVPDVAVSTGLRNLLYAVQWVVFAGFAVVVWWRSRPGSLVRERARPSRFGP